MNYPFLLTDSLWEEVRKYFAAHDRKRKYSLQIILSALLYLLKTGCQWRLLPQQYGKWQLVYYYYRRWTAYGTLEDLLYHLTKEVRLQQGKAAEPTAAVIDTQTVSNASGVSEETGYDGGKKKKGRKKSLATDTIGNYLAVGVSSAGLHDKKAVLSIKDALQDYGYISTIFSDSTFGGVPPFDDGGRIQWKVVSKRGGPFKVLPKRWVVERSFAWLMNFRRLVRDYEKKVQCAKSMILLAAIYITLKKLTT